VAAEPGPKTPSHGVALAATTMRDVGYRVVVTLDEDSTQAALFGALRRGYLVRAHIVTRSARVITLIRHYFSAQARTVLR
ncbi:MAG: hypothetical protein ACREOG_10660, partial [Gemmatimonadaceae bacterium]